MTKLKEFLIYFPGNDLRAFYAGQPLAGKVVVDLKEDMKVRNVMLHFYGEAKTHWTEVTNTGYTDTDGVTTRGDGGGEDGVDQIYITDKDVILQSSVLLFGLAPGAKGDNPIMKAGRHQFDFNYTLPPNCLTSYEGFYGHIRYHLKAIIDKPWKFNRSYKCPFTVVLPQDLNANPELRKPANMTNDVTITKCCVKGGEISVRFDIPRRGFVGGEDIDVNFAVTNTSQKKVKVVQVRLNQQVEYKAYNKRGMFRSGTNSKPETKLSSDTVGVPIKEQINSINDFERNGLKLTVMTIPPTMINNCRIIEVKYFVDITMSYQGSPIPLRALIPVTIGTVPLFDQASIQAQQPVPLMGPCTAFFYKSIYDSKDLRDADDDQHTEGDLVWQPSYIMHRKIET